MQDMETTGRHHGGKSASSVISLERVRRTSAASAGPAPDHARQYWLVGGDVILDQRTLRVWRGERIVQLSPTEFRLLQCLMSEIGCVFSRAELLRLVWRGERHENTRTVDVCIARLRRALHLAGAPDPIRTVRSFGYAFDDLFAATAPCKIPLRAR